MTKYNITIENLQEDLYRISGTMDNCELYDYEWYGDVLDGFIPMLIDDIEEGKKEFTIKLKIKK